mmetsp:Transcript_14448/g.41193  ORF Transcript_14448/g.41193 Transcript_14448/m.41193 type:complete len:222 (-) Transcript_14448:144-809(-)
MASLSSCFVRRSPLGDAASMAEASSRQAPRSPSAGTTRATSPQLRAVAASTSCPARRVSAACCWPTARGRNHEVPHSPPLRPILSIAGTNRQVSAATRTSAASARAIPPPTAAPLMPAMIGCGSSRSFFITPEKACCKKGWSAPRWCGSRMSKPAQNARPSPRMMTTRGAGPPPSVWGYCSASQTWCMSRMKALLIAFIPESRLRTISTTPSRGRDTSKQR